MIFIDRSQVKTPEILINDTGLGIKERNAAIAHYTGPEKDKPYNFTVYRNPIVKQALIKLFKGKCAYCESYFLHVYSGDVEHFRPKGEVTEADPNKPGYYWLASDWDNLLLSCRNCNQKLSHQLHGEASKKTLGKMNQFPLDDENERIRDHSKSISSEEKYRLLLNPCVDDPEKHLEYDETNAVVKPKKINGIFSAIGKKSIEVFVLQRVDLVHSREKVLLELLAQIQRVKEATINVNDNLHNPDSAKQFYFDNILYCELIRLKSFLNLEEEYLGMSRQIIGNFLRQFAITL